MAGTCQGWHFMTTPKRFTLRHLSYYLFMKWHSPLPTQLFCNLWTPSDVWCEISATTHLFYQTLTCSSTFISAIWICAPPPFDCCPWDISRGNLKEWLGQGASSFISTNNCPSWFAGGPFVLHLCHGRTGCSSAAEDTALSKHKMPEPLTVAFEIILNPFLPSIHHVGCGLTVQKNWQLHVNGSKLILLLYEFFKKHKTCLLFRDLLEFFSILTESYQCSCVLL